MDAIARILAERCPASVLEVGAGRGVLTRRLHAAMPEAAIVAIEEDPADATWIVGSPGVLAIVGPPEETLCLLAPEARFDAIVAGGKGARVWALMAGWRALRAGGVMFWRDAHDTSRYDVLDALMQRAALCRTISAGYGCVTLYKGEAYS